jgi:ABC-type phosphate transport system substrate-binding protein
MKKLMLGAAISAAMFGGAAQAAITLDGAGKVVVTPANTYEIYLSGASAALDYIEHLATSTSVIAADRMCDSTQPIYKFKDNGTGKDQNAYYCTLNPLNPQLVGLAGGKTELLIYKRSAGGSAMGVSPIIDDAKGLPSASIAFLNVDPSVCTVPALTAGLNVSTCTYSATTAGQFQNHKPDFGISDVDPEQFRGVNTPAGFLAVNPSDVSSLLNVDSAGGQVFGIGATLKLRNALQEAQFGVGNACVGSETEACMPSLTRDQIASIVTGKLDSWKDLKIGASDLYTTASAANKPGNANARVHICTRTDGSGTKAQMGINFLNYPCSTAATAPKADTGALGEVIASTQVHALASSGGVSECLRELDAGSNAIGTAFNNTYTTGGARWAIGIQGLEKNANQAEAWRFVKIDGVAPTLANVAKGKYHDWAELTFQYSKTHVWDTSEDLIVKEFIKAAGNPNVIVSLNATNVHPFGDSGYLASPKNFTPDVNGNFVSTYPVNVYSHATTAAAVNNCRIPAAYDLPNATNAGVQLQ